MHSALTRRHDECVCVTVMKWITNKHGQLTVKSDTHTRSTMCSVLHRTRYTFFYKTSSTSHNVNGNGIVVCAAHTIMWEKRRLWTTFSVLIVTKCLLFGDLFRECEKKFRIYSSWENCATGQMISLLIAAITIFIHDEWQKCSVFTLVTLISFMHSVEAIHCVYRALTLWVVKTMRECAIDQMQTNSRWTVV